MPRRTAAAALGVPVATLGHRLTRARAVLGRRLLRRGVLLGAGASLAGGGVAGASPARMAAAVRAALDTPPDVAFPLPLEVLPVPRAKLFLGVIGGLAVLGVGVTTVVLLTKTSAPVVASTDGGTPGQPPPPKPSGPQTVATGVANSGEAKGLKPIPAVPFPTGSDPAYSPNGKWMARTTYQVPADRGMLTKAQLELSDVATGEVKSKLDLLAIHKAEKNFTLPGELAVTDDGKRVFATGWMGGVRVWDTGKAAFEEKRLTAEKEEHVSKLQLAVDGKALYALLSNRSEKHRMRAWDADSGEELRTFDLPNYVWGQFVFTDGGKTIAGVTHERDGEKTLSSLRELDATTGKETRRIDLDPLFDAGRGQVRGWHVAYTSDGKQFVVVGGYWLPEVPADPRDPNNTFRGSGSAWVFDRESGKLTKTLLDRRFGVIYHVQRSADGKKMIVQPQLPGRLDREFGGPTREDAEFVELHQFDAATWERDWVKIVPRAEKWKLIGGAQ